MSDNLIGATTAIFIVSLSIAVAEPVSVAWATRDGSAKAGTDYQAASGVVDFLPGETQKQIEITVYGQNVSPTGDKNFFINLTPPTNAVLGTALIEAVIKVEDEAGVPVTSVIVAQGKRGLKGDPGLSAYEQAVLMGYEGTLEDWMQEQADAAAAAQRASDYAASAASAATKAENAATAASFLGNIFPTPEAGVDPVTGVGNGAYYNVRSTDDDSFLVEYQNIGGVPTPSGKEYPSSAYVQQLYDHVADLSEHVPIKFEIGKEYTIGERVVLNNGDIVRSTVSNNTTDPNLDMTGWVNFEADQKSINDKLFGSIELSSKQFGITGIGDETAKVQALVNYVNSNQFVTKVVFDTDIQIDSYLMFNRGVEVDFNGHKAKSTYDGAKFSALVHFKGTIDPDIYANLTTDNSADSNKFTVNDASGFQVGDYVTATYQRSVVVPTPTFGHEILVFTAQIIDISGNDIYLDHSHEFGYPVIQPWGTASGPTIGNVLALCKCYPVFGGSVENVYFENNTASTTTRMNLATFFLGIVCKTKHARALGIGGQCVHYLACRDFESHDVATINPRAVTGGRGYVIQDNGCNDGKHSLLFGKNERHTYDASFYTSRVGVSDSIGDGSASYSFGCHSTFISKIKLKNCHGSGGFFFGNSTNGNPTDGYFGSAVASVEIEDSSSNGTAAKIYLSPLVSKGRNKVKNFKIGTTSDSYGARFSTNTDIENVDVNTRVRFNAHQDFGNVIADNMKCTLLEGGQTDVVSRVNIVLRGGSIQTAQVLGSLSLVDGAKISNNANTNLLGVDKFEIEGGSINVTGATSDLTLNAGAFISESTDVTVGRNLRLIGGTTTINSKNVDAAITFGATNPIKLIANGAYIRTIDMTNGGANCKMQISNSEINYITTSVTFDYVFLIGNKINGGTVPTASARYIVANNINP